ncbi:S-layer homology domain-containing protein [Microcoleus sp. FACHB-68]|uniref:S-layer homology domain-containing protein n=1 Tax=Microcoleus sp. FACHB-68 TaxID=2692826 RepID=UPI001686250C|nr:S-layer homology domain-containing protein [Microcoleus sp. FACHB-68]
MLPYRRSAAFVGLAACLLISVTSCANSPTGKALEQSLAADPRLQENPATFTPPPAQSSRPDEAVSELPADFPSEIPLYPDAELQEVKPLLDAAGNPDEQGQVTRWTTSDSSTLVQNFYRKQFQENKWQLASQPTDDQKGSFETSLDNLQVKVFVEPAGQKLTAGANLVIKYRRDGGETAQPKPDKSPTAIVGGSTSSTTASPSPTPTEPAKSGSFTDLNKAPAELRQSVEDLAALGVLTPENAAVKTKESAAGDKFEPNKIITRREYARWLVAANNQIHSNQSARKIRLGLETAEPAFSDVSRKDPDFAVIQGLAEAGIIPSSLSGDGTDVSFRPDAPLTREQLLLWKVPLDTRRSLPTASTEAVQQTWGFQDAAKIDPKALRAVQADFQNGELSNIRRSFGYTTLLQPSKPVTRAEAGAALWYFGFQGEGLSAKDLLQTKRQSN